MTAVSPTGALEAVLDVARLQPSIRIALASSLDHIIAQDVIAPWPLPQWTAASMDGYAVRAADIDVGKSLPIAGGGDAGDPTPPPLTPGTAWRVATGGRVPAGADTVIRQEDTDGGIRLDNGAWQVTFRDTRDSLRNVRPVGGDVQQGQVVIPEGTAMTPGILGVLAALGESSPMVYRRPRIAILASGNEVSSLDDIERIASGDRIADVNSPMLTALARRAGGVPVPLGLVEDRIETMTGAIGATDADAIVSVGAISVGRRDHVVDAMNALGAEQRFRRVKLRPGGPTTLAVLPDGRPWLALPGNPVSAFVTWHLFGAPMVRRMMGDPGAGWHFSAALLGEHVSRLPTLDQFVRVTLERNEDDSRPLARLTGSQDSWVITSIGRADGLALVEAGAGTLERGSELRVLRLG
jgi:molybdopterin molybdotransferase